MEPTFTFEELKAGDPARLFLVDAHLHDPPARQHSFTPTFTGQETIIMTEQNAELRKRFKHCYYKVDSFSDVRVVWPMKWPAPAPNRLGWLPKLEFGNPENGPYYNQINPALAGVDAVVAGAGVGATGLGATQPAASSNHV